MQTNPAVEQSKPLDGPRVCGVSPVRKEKVYGGKDLKQQQGGRIPQLYRQHIMEWRGNKYHSVSWVTLVEN